MTYGSSDKSNTGNAGPNAVLSATLVGGGSTSFSYDNNGNLISEAGKTISYNALNKPTQITAGGSTVNFAYDANWQRFKKTVSGNRTVYYIDDSVVTVRPLLFEPSRNLNGVHIQSIFILQPYVVFCRCR